MKLFKIDSLSMKLIDSLKMKILLMLLITAVFLTMGAAAHAFEWFTANQYTVAWDIVTLKTDGTAIPSTDTVEYVAYLSNTVTDPDKTNPVEVYAGAEVQTVITLNAEGQYLFGVKSVRKIGDGTVVSESVIAWSDDPGATGDKPFGVRFYLSPATVTGIGKPSGG
jgi:hypothetical protein